MSDRTRRPPDRPILVVGAARSGTSWVARALGYAEGVRYVFEPDNVDADPKTSANHSARGFGPYPVIGVGGDARQFQTLWDVVFGGALPDRRGLALAVARLLLRAPSVAREPITRCVARVLRLFPRARERRIVKSIYVPFALEWLTDRYRPVVVLVQRNPLNVISSWREMAIPRFDLLSRPAILGQYATPRGLEPPSPDSDELLLITWCVGLLTTVLGDALERHPEWLLVTHEALCAAPHRTIRHLADELSLRWTSNADRFLAESNRPGNGLAPIRVTREQPDRWRTRLTSSEVASIDGWLKSFPRRGWVREPVVPMAATSAGG